MTDQISALIDMAEKEAGLPDVDDRIRCPDHPDEPAEVGFGLAGGGYGVYTLCPVCCRILSKSVERVGDV